MYEDVPDVLHPYLPRTQDQAEMDFYEAVRARWVEFGAQFVPDGENKQNQAIVIQYMPKRFGGQAE